MVGCKPVVIFAEDNVCFAVFYDIVNLFVLRSHFYLQFFTGLDIVIIRLDDFLTGYPVRWNGILGNDSSDVGVLTEFLQSRDIADFCCDRKRFYSVGIG